MINFGQIASAGISDSAVIDTKLATDAVTTAKIQNSAVTYAKIQNISATNRILGRKTAGAGIVEELTKSDVNSFLGISGTSSYLAFFDATGITSNNSGGKLQWDSASQTLKIMNSGTSSPIVQIGGTSASQEYGFKIDAAHDNVNNKFSAVIKAYDGGSSSFKNAIVARSTISANQFFVDTPNTVIEGIFQKDSNLYVSGDLTFYNGAGTSPTLTSITGGQNFIVVEFITGSSPSSNSSVFIIDIPVSFSGTGIAVPCAMNTNAASQFTNFFINGVSTTTINFYASTALPASTTLPSSVATT